MRWTSTQALSHALAPSRARSSLHLPNGLSFISLLFPGARAGSAGAKPSVVTFFSCPGCARHFYSILILKHHVKQVGLKGRGKAGEDWQGAGGNGMLKGGTEGGEQGEIKG